MYPSIDCIIINFPNDFPPGEADARQKEASAGMIDSQA